MDTECLIDKNKNQLIELFEEIKSISDEEFKILTVGSGGIGPHVRHLLNFYSNLSVGVKDKTPIDFQKRKENSRIERNREYALSAIYGIIGLVDVLRYESLLDMFDQKTPSYTEKVSLRNLLNQTLTHTVHHCAIIRTILLMINESNSDYNLQNKYFGYEESTIKRHLAKKIKMS